MSGGAPDVERLRGLLRARLDQCSTTAERPETAGGRVARLGGDAGPVLCFMHAAAGGIGIYRPVAEVLADSAQVYGLAPIEAEPPARSFEALAESRAAALAARLGGERPILVGWSLGGVLAHAVASSLERQRVPVGGVVLLDSRVPEADGDWASALGDRQFRRQLHATLRRQAGGRLNRATIVNARRSLARAVALAAAYRPLPLEAPVSFIAARRTGGCRDAVRQWRRSATRSFNLVELDCGHDELVAPDLAATTADAIRATLHPPVPNPSLKGDLS